MAFYTMPGVALFHLRQRTPPNRFQQASLAPDGRELTAQYPQAINPVAGSHFSTSFSPMGEFQMKAVATPAGSRADRG